MEDAAVTDTTKVFNNVENKLSHGNSDDLPMAKLLEQHSKEDHSAEMKEQAEKKISTEFVSTNSNDLVPKFKMWHSVGPIKMPKNETSYLNEDEPVHRTHSEEFINERSQNVFDLSQFQSENPEITMKTFLAMSSSPEGCLVLRQSDCLSKIIQFYHGPASTPTIRELASRALHYITQYNTDDKLGRREERILNMTEQLYRYCEKGENCLTEDRGGPVTALLKLSFDVDQRRTMCQFGALYALAKYVQFEYARMQYDVFDLSPEDNYLRRAAVLSLTNLTCGDEPSKELLGSMEPFMFALAAHLKSTNESICHAFGSLLRNIAWKTNIQTRKMLEHIDATALLMKTIMRVKRETTLTAISAAVWNLSAHGDKNKLDICNADNSIEFLVKMQTYQAPSGRLTVIENMSGILRNISKLVTGRDDCRVIMRRFNCFPVLLQQLKSPSLGIVSNACGTLWNLSARCPEDQYTLIQLGAVDMLHSLTHSKHKLISLSSSAALKNLITSPVSHSIPEACRMNTLSARKRMRVPHPTSPEPDSVPNVEVDPRENDTNYRTNNQVHDEDEDKSNSFRKVEEPYNDDVYNDYTETDLDEPTNYSLKFTEHTIETATTIPTPTVIETEVSEPKIPLSDEKAPLATPLMFSRSSSIDSISTCGELVDDQGSVVSEFSRAVSGIVTPSELPDSPSQTAPPTPRPQARNKIDVLPVVASKDTYEDEVTVFKDERPIVTSKDIYKDEVTVFKDERPIATSKDIYEDEVIVFKDERPIVASKDIYKDEVTVFRDERPIVAPKDIYEDEVTVFKDECTPTLFSVATSLSSLSFEDDAHVVESRTPENKFDQTYAIKTTPEPAYSDESKLDRSYILEDELDHTYVVESKSETTIANRTNSPISQTLMVSDEDKDDSLEVEVDLSLEEQQAILEACIVRGKPSLVPRVNGGNTDIVDEIANENVTKSNIGMIRENVNHLSFPSTSLVDSTVNYCTEDTPISISHAASNSDLSLLCPSEDSFLQNSILPLSSCLDSDDLFNDEEEHLLNHCIAIGKQSLNCNSTPNSLEENKSSQSSTLSEITEDLPIEDRTLIKDMTADANLISSMLTASSITDSVDGILDEDVSRNLSEEEEKALLNQCIAMGMQSMKDSSDLDNIGPPSFLAEANLDSSLINIEEITDYPPNPVKLTPNQRRRQIKERYNTYTLKQQSPTKTLSLALSKDEETSDLLPQKLSSFEERRIIEKDRFKTRTISKDDFEEIIKCQNKDKPIDPKKDAEVPTPTASQLPFLSPLHKSDESSTTSESEEIIKCQNKDMTIDLKKDVEVSTPTASQLPMVSSSHESDESSISLENEEIIKCRNKDKTIDLEKDAEVPTPTASHLSLVSSLHKSDESNTTLENEEIIKCQNKDKTIDLEKDAEVSTPTASQLPLVSSLHKSDESSTTTENEESFHERVVAKIVKPVMIPKTVKSGIPVVNSKIPKTKSSTPAKKLPPSELPVSLLRQNTFTKEESSSIPIRKDAGLRAVNNSSSKPTTPTFEVAETSSAVSPSFKSGIPSRISSVPKTGGKVNDMKSPDIVKNHRWSTSENNLNASSSFKGGSSTSLDSSSTLSTTPPPLKGNPSASQSALPVRKESTVRNNIAFYAYK